MKIDTREGKTVSMGRQKSLKINFIMNIILTMSSFIFPLISFPYISRILLPDGTGKVSLATSVVSYFLIFAQLGIPTYGIRKCAQVRDNSKELNQVVQELLIINLITSFITYAVYLVVVFTVPRFRNEKELYLVISITIIFNVIGMEWLYKGLEQYTYITVRSVIFKFVALIMMFLFVQRKSDYVIYGALTVLASSASNLLNLFYARHYVSLKPVYNYHFRRHLKAIGIFLAMSCATTIYVNLDTIMLGMIKTDTDVGYYNAAVKIRTVLLGIVTALGSVLLPRVSFYIEKNMNDHFVRVIKKAIEFVVVVAFPLTIYFIIFAEEGIYFLSGRAYGGAIFPMRLIMPTVFIVGISNITGLEILIPKGREIVVLYSEITGAIIDLLANLILIPFYGCAGAAVGTVIAEIAVLTVQICALKDFRKEIFGNINYITITCANIISVMCVLWVKKIHLDCFWVLMISAVIYFTIYGFLLLVFKEPLVTEIVHTQIKKFKRRE